MGVWRDFRIPGFERTCPRNMGNVDGYLSIVQVAMILIALFIGRRKPIYVVLSAWIVVCVARSFGLPIISPFVDAVPLIKLAAFYRYAPTSWEFCSAMTARLC
jgi:hypothetical protein